jgi:hypothetical protein
MNILETIIRGVLLEDTTKAKLRSMDAADFQTAKRAGAVFAYYAVVKGVKDETSLLNAVAGATMGSQGTDTRVGVGATGPYANGNFVYVVNTDDVQRKNVVSVWIMPALPSVNSFGGADKSKDQTEPDTKVARVGLKIGQSNMITKSAYLKRAEIVKKSNPSAEVADVTQMQDNTTGMQKAAAAVEKVADKVTGNTDDAAAGTSTTAEKKPWDGQPSPKQAGYPYKWWNGHNMVQPNMQGLWDMVYTMGPTDEWVYWRETEDTWSAIKKSEFESTYWTRGWQDATRAPSYKDLNKKAINAVEAKFGYGESSFRKYPNSAPSLEVTLSQDQNQNQQQNQNQDQQQNQNQGGLKKGDTLSWNVKTDGKVYIPVYYYDNKTKKFIQFSKASGKHTWQVGATKPKFQSASTNKKYYFVDINGSKFWIEAKNVK